MKITILCSSVDHPVNSWLKKWINRNCDHHKIELVRKKTELLGGDLLFLVSCSEIIEKEDRQKYKKALVLHASDLPRGRGWSPHVWQIIEGETTLCVTLLEAEDKVDSGAIWHKREVDIPKHFLFDEINKALFEVELSLMDYALQYFETIVPQIQSLEVQSTYYAKRSPGDSRVDPEQSIRSQFDLIRVCDPERFPAFFELHGKKYVVKLEVLSDE